MLRRSAAAFFAVTVAACGIKGPLKLPPANPPSPETAGAAVSPPASPDAGTPESPAAPAEKKP
jgi:predicted small lipoprotein YifL